MHDCIGESPDTLVVYPSFFVRITSLSVLYTIELVNLINIIVTHLIYLNIIGNTNIMR